MFLFRRSPRRGQPLRLHIGCGQEAIKGWINIDNQDLPGVDEVLDVRGGLPYRDVAAIYAEHFLEHLTLEQGLAFLKECRRALAPDGVLRLSTPNLDWVWITNYHLDETSGEESVQSCLQLNRAFHGWGHQFLYNQGMLKSILRAARFQDVVFRGYGESDVPELRGIERHETWQDTPQLAHVIIAEASGIARAVPLPEKLFQEHREAINTL